MDRAVLQRAFSAGAPVVAPERCVNTTFAGVNCTRCTDACPAGAIRLAGRAAEIDQSACVGCGACLPACPTEAFATRTRTPYLRLAFADLPESEGVVISCPMRPIPESGVDVIRHDRCLAELGSEQLVELVGGSGRDVWLDDRSCETCELAELGPALADAVGGANSLLQAAGQRPVVHLAVAQEPPRSRRGAVVVEARHGGMSRRGMFRRLIGEVTGRVAPEAGDDDLLPPRRTRLFAALDSMSPPPSDSASDVAARGFGDIVVDADRCSACGLCATFCPTGALGFTIISDRFDLGAQTHRCIDCGVCTAACPEAAIAVESLADVRSLVNRSSRTVASGSVVRCEVCEAPVAAAPGTSKRCFSCRGGVVSPLRDEAGLMADLLTRVPIET